MTGNNNGYYHIISFQQSILSLLLTKWVPEICMLCVNNKFITKRQLELQNDPWIYMTTLSANVRLVDVCPQAFLVQRHRALTTTIVRGLCHPGSNLAHWQGESGEDQSPSRGGNPINHPQTRWIRETNCQSTAVWFRRRHPALDPGQWVDILSR